MNILSIVGARPNFIKVVALHRAFSQYPALKAKLVHTGQHQDDRMSAVFFKQLDLPSPDYYLGVAAGTQTYQTAEIMRRLEPIIEVEQPDWVLVVGDVTSTLAGSLVAGQKGVPVAHVEAGLRSGDRRMPEERNRILTDAVADRLFVTEQAGLDNLKREGVADEKIWFVGNVMIDSLVHYRARASQCNTVRQLGLLPGNYILMTMHRPANVDGEAGLLQILQIVENTARCKPVVFPMHPRTRASLARFGLLDRLNAIPNVRVLEPQGYLEFLNLMEHAAMVITDSGGVQEETTYLRVPCLTLRDSTERPVTVELGTNHLLADLNPQRVQEVINDLLSGCVRLSRIPPLWDGEAAQRIARIMNDQ